MTRIEKGPGWELRLGRWQDVLADVAQVDSVITDPPYSERTHAGQRTGSSTRTPTITYDAMTDYAELASLWSQRTRMWACVFSDHSGSHVHEQEWESAGWYVFAPVGWIKDVYAPRLSGDGPACGMEYITVARPKKRMDPSDSGHRCGYYLVKGRYSCDAPSGIAGQKDINGMRAIVRDYSRPGDLVCDPYAGSGTTLLAAVMEGRRAIGAEMDEGRFDMAVRRLRGGFTTDLFGGA